MKDSTETLIEWLRDAHAMETNLIAMLDTQTKRMDDYPLMQKRLAEHTRESRSHAQRVEECLSAIGGDTSGLKDLAAKMGGRSGPMLMAASPDEPVKGALTNIAAEHFEIASYRSLKAAAKSCGHDAVAEVVQSILTEEEAMAEWLEHHLEWTTQTYMDHRSGTAVE